MRANSASPSWETPSRGAAAPATPWAATFATTAASLRRRPHARDTASSTLRNTATSPRACETCRQLGGRQLRGLELQLEEVWSAIDAIAHDHADEVERSNGIQLRVRELECAIEGDSLLDALAVRVAAKLAALAGPPPPAAPPSQRPEEAERARRAVELRATVDRQQREAAREAERERRADERLKREASRSRALEGDVARLARELAVLRRAHSATEAELEGMRAAQTLHERRLDRGDASLAAVAARHADAVAVDRSGHARRGASQLALQALRADVANLRLELDAAMREATDEARVAAARAGGLETALKSQGEFWQRQFLDGSRTWQAWRDEIGVALQAVALARGGGGAGAREGGGVMRRASARASEASQ